MLPFYSNEFIEDNVNNDLLEITISYQLFLEMLLRKLEVKLYHIKAQ